MIYNKEVKGYYCNKCSILKAKKKKVRTTRFKHYYPRGGRSLCSHFFIVVMQNAKNYKQKLLHFNTLCTKTNTKFDGGGLWSIILQQVFNGRNTIWI